MKYYSDKELVAKYEEKFKEYNEINRQRLEILTTYIKSLEQQVKKLLETEINLPPRLVIVDNQGNELVTIEEEYIKIGEYAHRTLLKQELIFNISCEPFNHSGAYSISYYRDNNEVFRQVIYLDREKAFEQFAKLKQTLRIPCQKQSKLNQ